jgi:hypothetical protein
MGSARPKISCMSALAPIIVLFAIACTAIAQVPLVQLSTDTFSNTDSLHSTEIEPDTFAWGSTIVATFQVGRAAKGGASDTGFATSTDGGLNWVSGFLPGISKAENPDNPYDRANDPGVGYDAKHGVWLIVTMPWSAAKEGKQPRPPVPIPAAVVSRSFDGINWENPIVATPDVLSSDKPWIACDNFPSSPFYGNCYISWDIPRQGGLIQMNTSSDGGLTWGPSLATPDNAGGIGGQPLIQPDGTVIVPFINFKPKQIAAFRSSDGGASWSTMVKISKSITHTVAANMHIIPEPSSEIDRKGRVYVVWQDCRFRPGCTSNDLLISSSLDGILWKSPARIPIDALDSNVDHFIPGLAVDPTTSAKRAHLALTYFYLSEANCTVQTCDLNVGFVSSSDSGTTWSTPLQLAGPMKLSWLPTKNKQPMFADYISTSWVEGKAFGVFPVAQKKVGTSYNMAIYTNRIGLPLEGDQRHSGLADTSLLFPAFDGLGNSADWLDFLDADPRNLYAPTTSEILAAY